ncbi:MAG: ATP-dependent helicase RecG [Frankiales bacterium]|nr:ATP-dependent helicase RecG [Frankiales bacterium]
MRLDTPLVKVLGDKTATPLEQSLQLRTVGDLLHHYPFRYFQHGALTNLGDLEVGDHVTVLARVQSSGTHKARNGKLLGKVVVTDGTGTLELAFFGRAAIWNTERLKPGSEHLFAGTISEFRGQRQLTHPTVFLGSDDKAFELAGKVLPIYPASSAIDTIAIGKCVAMVLPQADLDQDPLPDVLRLEHRLMTLREALETVHDPKDLQDVTVAHRRLRWDEAFVLQVVLARRRKELEQQGGTPRGGRLGGVLDLFDAQCPWVLTDGQVEIGKVISTELARSHPMHRLLQGEVGSGKTVVALRAMLTVVDSGGQAALLAPTEVLAQQHVRSLRDLLGSLATGGQLGSPDEATRVTLLTGSVQGTARRRALDEIASGEAGIVVGTHALMSEGVEFRDLGLVVVDEQHRFGVEQREALRAKGKHPHVLVMTATPIPRTVAMTVFGDLEVSTLRELPRGRSPITTTLVRSKSPQLKEAMDHIGREVSSGRQAFVVCPRIGDEEPAQQDEGPRPPLSVFDVLDGLQRHYLPGLRSEMLHGRMTSDAKDDVMGRFAQGDIEVLVSTTVIEVGVDVPNATVMVVMDADRFGISQLHQLRGRIGRGGHAGTCYLVSEAPPGSATHARLEAVAATTDGFALSKLDLQVREEGDVLGKEQSGKRSSLRFLKLADLEVIEESRARAVEIVEQDPDLTQHPALRLAVDAIHAEEQKAFIERG